MRIWLPAVALLALTVVSEVARSDESKVPLSEVPKAGLEAVNAMFPDAAIGDAAKETEDGKTVYEVSLKQNGRNIDVTIGADGKIQLVEKEIADKDLPTAVRRTLEAKYPKATYKIIEEVKSIKNDKSTLDFFETLLVTASKEIVEVQITPDGKIKNEEKKQAEKD
ncbi:MAG: PepSY-like domain-containing protein [Planctomycetia bacterium]|nr:PepSY-like domain-containing protein [Planctomycetia bacterium]